MRISLYVPEHVVLHSLRFGYIDDSENIYWWLEDQSRLIGRDWLLIYWDDDFFIPDYWYELILDVHEDCIETVGW